MNENRIIMLMLAIFLWLFIGFIVYLFSTKLNRGEKSSNMLLIVNAYKILLWPIYVIIVMIKEMLKNIKYGQYLF